MPAVRIRDNMRLEADAYRVLIGGREVAKGKLRPDLWLAINPGTASGILPGEPTTEPAFGLPAQWITSADRQRAEMSGYTVVDAPTVAVTHLGEIVRRFAHELFSREDLKALLDKVRESSPAIVDELIPNILTTGVLHRVLILLLEERVPISNLTRILESLGNHAPAIKDVFDLTEKLRIDIGRSICDGLRDEQGRVRGIVFDPRVELELRRGVQDRLLSMEPAKMEQLVMRLAGEMRKAMTRRQEVALLCDASLRRPLRQSLVRSLGDLPVVAYQEIPTDMLMEPFSFIRPEDLNAPVPPAAGLKVA
jgi:flagellar biosynthesis protein FlhA